MSSWRVGDVKITRVVEFEFNEGLYDLLTDATREACLEMSWMQPHFMTEDGSLLGGVHALVIETDERRIIVDTCAGNDKNRDIPVFHMRDGPFLNDLRAAGFPPETIDTVLCTHMHVDHVGWNTMLVGDEWVPTFSNARYLFGKDEYDHWQRQTAWDDQITVFADSVAPVFKAGLADLVETSHVLCDEVRLIPTLGHSPGHVSVMIESKGEAALITGDSFHHPCQFCRSDWAAATDHDSNASTETRRRMIAELADTQTLIFGTHFAAPSAGYLIRDGDSFRFRARHPT